MQLSGLQLTIGGAKAPVARAAATPPGALLRVSHPAHQSQLSHAAWAPCVHARRAAARQAVVSAAAAAAAPTKPAPQYTVEYQAAVEAVKLASHLCQAVQTELKRGEASEKDDSSPVTVADYGAQALVAWSLLRSFPGQDISLVAEEDSADLRAPEGAAMLARITTLVNETLSAVEPGAAALSSEDIMQLVDLGCADGGGVGRHWVLDPIDGTRGFVGMRQYAVCLGMLQDGSADLGVLGCPNLPQYQISESDCAEGQAGRSFSEEDIGTIFAARRGHGTFAGPLFDAGLPPTRVHCNDTLPPAEVRFMQSFEAAHSNHGLAGAVGDEIGIVLPSLKLDSQAKYGALARGDASIFMRFPDRSYREKIWDHCAGVVVVTEAGACITDAKGNPLDFTLGRFFPDLNGGIVAATPSMHRAIMAALRKLGM